MSQASVPMPDLRIVPTSMVFAHEDHDIQRSMPLIERMRSESVMINPPLVAPMDDGQFVVLDGANRAFVFAALGFPHILVQVASYHSGQVELATWHHVLCDWDADALVNVLQHLPETHMSKHAHDGPPAAEFILRDERTFALWTAEHTLEARNRTLRELVGAYVHACTLQRTSEDDAEANWRMHPAACAMVRFRPYTPDDILESAEQNWLLPPGVSRHIVHGRAIRVNYPLAILRDERTPPAEKNLALEAWMRDKIAHRQVRYYAEATYQFDE